MHEDWPWSFRYTAHLGYQPPEYRPQFAGTVGRESLVEHVQHAADLGFAGLLYPWALQRPTEEVWAVAAEMRARNLHGSVVVCTPLDATRNGIWVRRDIASRRQLEAHIRRAAKVAQLLRAKTLAALIVGVDEAGGTSADEQWACAVENFAEMADIAAGEGTALAVEPLQSMPYVRVDSVATALRLLGQADSASAGLIFDTAHIAQSDGDLITALDESFDRVKLVQLADLPGRVEPGAGDVDLVSFAVHLASRGYDGLVDLEHGWLDDERAGTQRLREFDDAVRARVASSDR